MQELRLWLLVYAHGRVLCLLRYRTVHLVRAHKLGLWLQEVLRARQRCKR